MSIPVGLPSLRDELHPYLVLNISGGQADCATWQITDGGKAIALFLSAETAGKYADRLGAPWRAMRPPRAGLLELIRLARSTGIQFAVLDPDDAKASRVFDLNQILAVVDG